MTACRPAIGSVLIILVAARASAQGPPPPPPPASEQQDVTYKETVVVTASKTEQQLTNAPATMTVIGERMLALSPSNSYADILRNVPGVNITQLSARDVNITSRAATSSLATSQLAVLDGRSLYLDFFGFVMWDFMPVNLSEIKQIEVIRGPASAVWGANALNGVINVVTKTPRELAGTTFTLGIGEFDKDVTTGGTTTKAPSGSLYYLNGTHAAAVNDRVAYKISAGTYVSDAFARPTGVIPNGQARPTSYPSYPNSGTTQPKVDARVDYTLKNGGTLQFSGGAGGTKGIMHTGIGPFDVDNGSMLGYGKVNYANKGFRFQVFTNVLDGDAKNLLTVDQQGQPINFVFNTKSTDVELGDTRTVGTKQVFTFGGNLRFNQFHLTLAPAETARTEGGAYVQDEMILSPLFRLVAGARVDKFSNISKAVVSPRVAFLIKPKSDQTLRVTYNRAFRAPSMINNNLDITIANPLPLAAISPAFGSAVFLVPTVATGNADLKEEHIDAFEVGYTGNVRDRATLSAAVYFTRFSDEIFFTQTGEWVTAPPGFPGLPAFGLSPNTLWGLVRASGVVFPSAFTYRNLGEEKNKGIELGIDATLTRSVNAFVNYSYQSTPDTNFALSEANLPAKNRFNAGVSCSTAHGFGNLTVSYADKAFWQDVLDDRFHGETKAYTTVNLTIGAKFAQGRYTAALKVMNLGNQQVMQHIFGDIIRRQVVGELRVALPK